MTIASLPSKLPEWYGLEKSEESKQLDKGWSPKTTDIKHITDTWWSKEIPPANKIPSTIKLNNVSILSPLQIGGGALPERHNLPAQIVGIPCIPGSSFRGSFLSWIVNLCREYYKDILLILALIRCGQAEPGCGADRDLDLFFDQNLLMRQKREHNISEAKEYTFWNSYLFCESQKIGWKPKAIRFETTYLKDLTAFPLNPQQEWQVFGKKDNKLAVMWQFPAIHPNSHSQSFPPLKIDFWNSLKELEKTWVTEQLKMMLLYQGIGKGLASGFGRLGDKSKIPKGEWQIKLKGMKPAIGGRIRKKGQVVVEGSYRWSPQVLRACLRGHFTRLALTLMTKENAIFLTDTIFGSLKKPGKLFLTSYLINIQNQVAFNNVNQYSNIPKNIVDEIWTLNVNCNQEFHGLIDNLLSLASKLGGLGAAWRKPPHSIHGGNIYRGSSFTVNSLSSIKDASQLIENIRAKIKELAEITKNQYFCVKGGLISIWQQLKQQDQPYDLIHKICATNAKNRPYWCGYTEQPSLYSISDRGHYNLVSVFDPQMHQSLVNKTISNLNIDLWQKLWSCC